MPSIRTISVSGSIPSITQLALGDLAINTYDGKAYIKKQQGTTQTVLEVGTGGGAGGGVTQIIAGTNITISPVGGTGAVTINASSTTVSASYAETASYVNPLHQNVTISGSLLMSGSIQNVYYIDFNTTASGIQPSLGRFSWNQTDKTLEIGTGDGNTTLQIGQETVYPPVVNKDSVNLGEGTLVMVDPTGIAQGNRIRVVRAISNGTYPSQYLVGILTEDIAKNQEGFATWFGYVRNLSITTLEASGIKPSGESWVEGNVLYPNPAVSGGLTYTQPTSPAIKSTIAVITAINGNNLTLLVRPTFTLNVGELNNVNDTTTSTSHGELFVKSGSVWTTGRSLTGSYSITGSLTVSGSSTFTNIGPAIFSGSVTGISGFTGSLQGTSSWAVSASSAITSSFPWFLTGSNIVYDGGNVGVGTSTPSDKFTVNGIVNATNDSLSVGRGAIIGNGINPTFVQVLSRAAGGYAYSLFKGFAANTTTGLSSSILDYGALGNLQSGTTAPTITYSYFGVGTGSAYNNTHLRIYDNANKLITVDGNLNVGTTTNSGYKLQVRGSGTTSSTTALRIENANASSSLVVLDNGYVGIGTNTVNETLSVNGTIVTYHTNYTTDAFKITHNSNDVYLRLFKRSDQTNPQVLFGSTGNNYVLSSMGIGTSAPSASLHISGSSGSVLLEVDSNSVQNILFVSGSGNVGIGTSSPTVKLQIQATGSNETTQRWLDNTGNTLADFAELGDAGILRIGYAISPSSTNRPLITLNGGSSNTTAIISMRGKSGLNNIALSTDTNSYISGSNLALGYMPGTVPAILTISGSSGSALLKIDSNSVQNILFVSGSGNVGINTLTPQNTLDVSGSGRFTNNLTVTGSLQAPSITGSLQGTASYATNAGYAASTPTVASTFLSQCYLLGDQSIPNSIDTIINFERQYDPNLWFDPGTRRFKPTVAGYYLFTFGAWLESPGVPSGQWNIQLRKSTAGSPATTWMIVQQPLNNAGVGQSAVGTKIIYMDGNLDYVDFTAYQASGASKKLQYGGTPDGSGTWFSAHLITM